MRKLKSHKCWCKDTCRVSINIDEKSLLLSIKNGFFDLVLTKKGVKSIETLLKQKKKEIKNA